MLGPVSDRLESIECPCREFLVDWHDNGFQKFTEDCAFDDDKAVDQAKFTNVTETITAAGDSMCWLIKVVSIISPFAKLSLDCLGRSSPQSVGRVLSAHSSVRAPCKVRSIKPEAI